jgi:hypothetical protein
MKQTSTGLYTGLKLRTLLLTSVSSVVLLSGCETYQNIKYNFFNIRPAQQVEGERRMPMLNTRYTGYGVPDAPQAQAAPQQAARAPAAQTAAPASAPTPYDQFDAQGNAQAPQMQPMVVTPQPQAAAQPATLPAAKPAPQASEGNFFTRMFNDNSSGSEKPAARKQFPGNPMHSKHTESAAPVPQGPLTPPVEGAIPLGDDTADMKLMPESPEPTAPLLDKQVSATPPSDAPWWQRPASSEQKTSAVIAPKEQPSAPLVEQVQEMPKTAEIPAPVAEARPVVVLGPETDQSADKTETQQADAIPFDYEPQEPGEETTVSRLSDKKNKPQPNWFERNFSRTGKKSEPVKQNSDVEFVRVAPDVQESKSAVMGNELATKADTVKPQEQVYAAAAPEQTQTQTTSKRTWIERVLGFKDAPTPEQQAPYPNVASVPPTPDTFDAIKGATPLAMEEMEADRDQAVVSKMELNSEPSGQAVAPMAESQPANPEPATPVVSNPITPAGGDAQLLGHVSDPPKMEKPEGKATDSKQLKTKPADGVAPAQTEADGEEKDDQEWPSKPSSSLTVPPVVAAEPVITKPETASSQSAEKPKEEKSFLKSVAWPWQDKKSASESAETKPAEPGAEAVKLQAVNAPEEPSMQQGLTALSWDDEPAVPAAVNDPVAPLVPQPAIQKAAAPAEMVVPAQTPSPAWVATSAGGTPPAAAIAPPVPDFATSQPENSLPPLAAQAPKLQTKEEEQKAASAAVESSGGTALPSPQLLQKVKPLPPSRYETRRKQAQ